MAKRRWRDVEIWKDPWYRKLSGADKHVWGYICDNCDCAGVWKVDKDLAEFQINMAIDWDNVLTALDGRVIEITPEKWYVVKFVEFQYGRLSPGCKMHLPVIRALEHHGLTGIDADIERVSKGYPKGIDTPDIYNNINNNNNISVLEDVDVVENNPDTEECAREGEGEGVRAACPAPQKNADTVSHKHGQYGWVRLTGEEYSRLLADFGDEKLREYITIVDEYAEANGNAKKYKNWNLVLRKAIRDGWGVKKNQNGFQTLAAGRQGRKEYEYERKHREELERRLAADE